MSPNNSQLSHAQNASNLISTHLTQKRVFILLLVLAGLLRLGWLDRWPLWTDEYHTLYVAEMNTLMTEGVPNDQHPPLYYLLMAAMVEVSENEIWLRLPSALAGLGAVAMMWPIGRALGRPRLGLLAAVLLAFFPLHIWYSREARMYGPASLMWVVAIYFFIQSLRRDKLLDMFGLAASLLGGIFLAYPTLALWLLQAALFWPFWYLQGHKPGRVLRWLLAQALVIAGLLAWLPFWRMQMGNEWTFYWQFGFIDISGTLADTLQMAALAGVMVLAAYLVILLLFAFWPAFRQFWQRNTTIWAVLMVAAYIILLIGGTIPRALSIRRQLLVFLPILVLLAAWGFTQLHRRRLEQGVVILALVLSLYTVFSPAYEDWRSPVLYLAAQEAPGDQLILHPQWNQPAFTYYYEGEAIDEVLVTRRIINETEEDIFPAGTKVWVLANNTPGLSPEVEQLFNWLAARGELVDVQHYSTYIELRAYQMNGAATP